MIRGWVNDDRVNYPFKLMCCWLCLSGMCLLLTELILQYMRVCVCVDIEVWRVWGCNTIKQELVDMAFSFQKEIWIEPHLKIGSGMSGRSQHNDSSTSWWSDPPWICVWEKRTKADGRRRGLPVGASMARATLPTNVSGAIAAIWPGGINQQHVLALTTVYPFQHTRWCNHCQSQPPQPHDLLLLISPSASCMCWANGLRWVSHI